ncbi:MAG TPA: RDD family protein [Gemmatimonadaceae bacterium]|nr:RDD family protein [Gemmatimonadaceae bacterium]
MYTVEDFRARYSRASDQDLLSLLETDPAHLTPEARVALAEEAERRALRLGDPVRGVPILTESLEPSIDPKRNWYYAKAPLENRLGASMIDGIVGLGPVIFAAILGWIFHLGQQSHAIQVFNMIATSAWGLYYRFTKDARLNGQSIGKKICNLMVIDVETGAPCSLGQSIGRAAVLFFLNVIPILGWLVEPIAVLTTDDGRRLGDRAAGTQVVEVSRYEATRFRLPSA